MTLSSSTSVVPYHLHYILHMYKVSFEPESILRQSQCQSTESRAQFWTVYVLADLGCVDITQYVCVCVHVCVSCMVRCVRCDLSVCLGRGVELGGRHHTVFRTGHQNNTQSSTLCTCLTNTGRHTFLLTTILTIILATSLTSRVSPPPAPAPHGLGLVN